MLGAFEAVPTDMNFESSFKVINFVMRLNRSHPNIKKNWQWACQLSLMYGVFFFIFCILVYSLVFHDLKNDNFTQACANGILCVVFSVVTFNYLVLLYYDNIFKNMILKMNRDYEVAKNFAKQELNVVLHYAQKGRKVINIWIVIAICSSALFPVKSIVLMTYYTIMDEFKLVHLYDLTYPPFVEEIKDELSVYLTLNAIFLFFDLYAVAMYIAFVPLGPIFMLHACGQLELANMRIMRIFKENHKSDEIIRRFQDIGRLLDDTYSFINNAKDSLKILYELTLKSSIFFLPITLYQVLKSFDKGEIRIEFISMIVACLTLVSIPSYYSNVLMSSGEKLRLAVYSCGWEKHWDKKCRTIVLLFLVRTSQPVAIRTMFRVICLDALTDVYHQSYAIFNVLNAVWK